ncbi:MAG: NTP transferase domain-containing protein [Oleiphilaceae bacterium]|nr:NTP transferase domain-containing protein [Oleiphilaceae bacterium]
MAVFLTNFLVLAAGEASRFGSPKQLAELQGDTLLQLAERRVETLAQRLHESGDESKSYLVLGANREKIYSAVDAQKWTDLVVCENWKEGMAASIYAGLSHCLSRKSLLNQTQQGTLILLLDQPVLNDSDLVRFLLNAIQKNCMYASAYPDSIGPPVYFPKQSMNDFMRWYESGGRRPKKFLGEHDVKVGKVGGVQQDVDTPADLANLDRPVV